MQSCAKNRSEVDESLGLISDGGFIGLGILNLSDGLSYHLYRRETDMRRSFDSLCGIVLNELGRHLLDKDAFVFINKHHTHLKLLVWQKNGFSIFYHRLDKGTFEIPVFDLDARSVQLSAHQLSFMLAGMRSKR
jgi:transposase